MHVTRKLVLAAVALLLAVGAVCAREVVIDVRTGQEFQSGHIQGAMNMPYTSIGEDIHTSTVAKDDHIVLYCKSGRRSGIAYDTLKALGYANVENYGGMEQARLRLQLPVHTDH